MNKTIMMSVIAFAAVAAFAEPPQRDFIGHLDQDGDGKVSAAEFDGPPEHFADFDKDNDGYISATEAPKGPPPSFCKRLDRDGDGKVSAAEFDGPPEHFADFDQNGDGFVTDDEAPKGPPPDRRGPPSEHGNCGGQPRD